MRNQLLSRGSMAWRGLIGLAATGVVSLYAMGGATTSAWAAPEGAGATGLVATGLVNVAPTPNVSCPPTDQSATVIGPVNAGVATAAVLNVSCTSKPTLNAADSSVADLTVLGVDFSAISSHCYATTEVDPGSSSVVTVNGTQYVSRNVHLSFAGFHVILNETTVSGGQLTQNAVHIIVPPLLGVPGQDIIVAQVRCRMPTG